MILCKGLQLSQITQRTKTTSKKGATHFEIDLDDKIGGNERETTPEPSLLRCGQKLGRKREERERWIICDWALRASRTCLLAFCGDAMVGGLPGGVKNSATDHIRIEIRLKQTLTRSQHLKRTNFGGPRRYMEHRGNKFVTEWSADGNYKKPAQQWSCAVWKNLSRTHAIVRFAMRVP